MRPRHYDRFVLIGLCWLYGRSEFPPPQPALAVTGTAFPFLPQRERFTTSIQPAMAYEDGSFLVSREREIHYVHWASKAYEDESVFMSEANLGWQ